MSRDTEKLIHFSWRKWILFFRSIFFLTLHWILWFSTQYGSQMCIFTLRSERTNAVKHSVVSCLIPVQHYSYTILRFSRMSCNVPVPHSSNTSGPWQRPKCQGRPQPLVRMAFARAMWSFWHQLNLLLPGSQTNRMDRAGGHRPWIIGNHPGEREHDSLFILYCNDVTYLCGREKLEAATWKLNKTINYNDALKLIMRSAAWVVIAGWAKALFGRNPLSNNSYSIWKIQHPRLSKFRTSEVAVDVKLNCQFSVPVPSGCVYLN